MIRQTIGRFNRIEWPVVGCVMYNGVGANSNELVNEYDIRYMNRTIRLCSCRDTPCFSLEWFSNIAFQNICYVGSFTFINHHHNIHATDIDVASVNVSQLRVIALREFVQLVHESGFCVNAEGDVSMQSSCLVCLFRTWFSRWQHCDCQCDAHWLCFTIPHAIREFACT